MVSKLGEMLVKAQLITDTQLDEVIKIQRREGGKLGSIVVRAGFCSDQDIVSFLGMQYGVPAADLEQWPPIEPSIIALIPKDLAQRHKVLPLQRTGNVLTLAMSDPTDIFAMDDVRFHTGYNVDPVVSSEMGLVRAVEKYYGGNSAVRLADGSLARNANQTRGGTQGRNATQTSIGAPEASGPTAADAAGAFDEEAENFDLADLEQELDADADFDATDEDDDSVNVNTLKRGSEDAPVVKLVNMVLIDAIKRGASDIHIEPYEKTFRIRLRQDGVCQNLMNPPLRMKSALVVVSPSLLVEA